MGVAFEGLGLGVNFLWCEAKVLSIDVYIPATAAVGGNAEA